MSSPVSPRQWRYRGSGEPASRRGCVCQPRSGFPARLKAEKFVKLQCCFLPNPSACGTLSALSRGRGGHCCVPRINCILNINRLFCLRFGFCQCLHPADSYLTISKNSVFLQCLDLHLTTCLIGLCVRRVMPDHFHCIRPLLISGLSLF